MLWTTGLLASTAPADGGTEIPFAGLISYGALGIIVLLAIFGYVTFKPDITRLEKQMEKDRVSHEKAMDDMRAEYSKQIDALRGDYLKQLEEVRAERDKADDQRNAMADTFQKEWIPALVKFLTTTETLFPLLQKMVDRPGGDNR